MNSAPTISRVLRCESQRSIQAKTARTSRMLKAAKAASASAVQAKSSGRAIVTPTQMPRQHSAPMMVETSASPKTTYSR